MSLDFSDATSQKIMAAGKTVFWKHGIKRVSVEEICTEAGVSKMTFYRKFKNKTALAHALLQAIYRQGFDDYVHIMNRDISFPEKVKEIVLMKHRSEADISLEFMREVYQTEDPDIQKLIAEVTARGLLRTRQDFEKAQTEGWIRSELSLDSIFYLLGVIQEKVHDPAFMALHKSPHDAILELVQFFFYGILNQNKERGEN